MTGSEYELLQEQLRNKLYEKRPYDPQKYKDGYRDGLKCAMSILHQYYNYHNFTEGE